MPALLTLAEGKPTTDPGLSQILMARKINQFLGVQLWPAELEELPEEFIEAIHGLVDLLPTMQAGTRKVEDWLTKWRARHPTYGKK